MTITLENGDKVIVFLCDVHAEDATIKSAKAAYLDRATKLEQILAQAAALGFNLATVGSNAITSDVPTPVPVVKPPAKVLAENVDDGFIDASIIDNASMNIRVGGNGAGGADRSYNTSELQKIAGPAKAKVDVVNIRGIDMVIPTKKIDQSGTTTIRINNSFDDRAMQQKFRQISAQSIDGGNNIQSYKDGYQTRSCPLCNGTGHYVNRGVDTECAKCDGSGEIVI